MGDKWLDGLIAQLDTQRQQEAETADAARQANHNRSAAAATWWEEFVATVIRLSNDWNEQKPEASIKVITTGEPTASLQIVIGQMMWVHVKPAGDRIMWKRRQSNASTMDDEHLFAEFKQTSGSTYVAHVLGNKASSEDAVHVILEPIFRRALGVS
jgi:hypothetical protein